MKNASAKEEKKVTIKQAGMLLSDDELDQVSGGMFFYPNVALCPYNSECKYYTTTLCDEENCCYAKAFNLHS